MEITAKIVKTFPQSKTLKAVANVTIDGCFVVHGVKVVETEKGTFIAMPSEKRGDKFRDICHPVTSDTRQYLTETVLAALGEVVPSAPAYDTY